MRRSNESEVCDVSGRKRKSAAPAGPGAYMRERMRERLDEALRLLDGDGQDELPRFERLLEDVLDRVAALQLTGRAAVSVSARTLASGGGVPVREFLLVPYGDVQVERGVAGESFEFSPRHAAAAVRWFERIGRKLAIDYEHQSLDVAGRSDGLRPAAGWIGGLEAREDGLWAVDVTWTDRAAELLASGEYRCFSPVIYWTDEHYRELAALGPVALTNDPAMQGVSPLAAGRRRTGDEGRDKRRQASAREAEALVPAGLLAAARAEAGALRERIAASEADAFVERGLRLGKIVESTRADWREDYVRDPRAAEERLSRSPVVLPPGRVVRLDGRRAVLPLPRESRGAGSEMGGGWDIEPEDLEACDRAVAAGRVRGLAG